MRFHHLFIKNPREHMILRQIIIASSSNIIHPHEIFKRCQLTFFPIFSKFMLFDTFFHIKCVLKLFIVLLYQRYKCFKLFLISCEFKANALTWLEVDFKHLFIEQEFSFESKSSIFNFPFLVQTLIRFESKCEKVKIIRCASWFWIWRDDRKIIINLNFRFSHNNCSFSWIEGWHNESIFKHSYSFLI